MLSDFGGWPATARTAALSLLVIAVAYVLGQIGRWVVASRLGTIVRRTPGDWNTLLVSAVARRVPFWSVLVGIYIAASFWVLAPNIATALERTLYFLMAASITFLAAEVLVGLVRAHGPTIDPSLPRTTITENIVRIVTITIGLLIILKGVFNLEITPILTALGVGGLAVALALQDTLANLFAGFYLTVSKQLRIGHYIRLSSGEEGYLEDIDWRVSRLKQLSNNTILIPNAKLSQSILTDYYLPEQELAVVIEASVHYGSDLAHVERVTTDVAREVMQTVAGGVTTFEPFVRFHTLGDPGIGFSVILRAREFVDQHLIKHEFVKRLHARYAAEGIAIPIKAIAQTRQEPPATSPQ